MSDELLIEIEETLDDQDAEIDYETAGGILTLSFVDGSKVIINKQPPLQQIWVATKFNGHHFAYRDGEWRDIRSGDELWQFLEQAISTQAGAEVVLRAK